MARVLLYSDNETKRERVRLAVGRTPDRTIGPLEWVDADNVIDVNAALLDVDLVILDAEAQPAGGMGIARALKAEIADPPPVILLIARKDDAWLARWSLAEVVVPMPIDPPELTTAVVRLLTERLARPEPEVTRNRFGLLRRSR